MSAALKVISAAIFGGVYLKQIAERARASLGSRFLIATCLYVVLLATYLAVMPSSRVFFHSPHNHYTLQADAWLAGRLDLGGPPPSYTGHNDFAQFGGKTFVSFPPVPAVLMLPVRMAMGSAERVPDPLVFALLAPLGPVLVFLALERLRTLGRSPRTRTENGWLAFLLGVGTVYWFSAVQGSVWFGGHVVAMLLTSAFLLASLDARHPLLAGVLLALAFGTRPTAALALPVFVYEWWRARSSARPQLRPLLLFAAGASVIVLLLMAHNAARFGDPMEFGHRHLAIRWRERIDTWGLFSLHYLPRNLSVFFGGLPFWSQRGWQINAHGLALWFTTPIYLWALWPQQRSGLWAALAISALAMASAVLCYQNTGWIQFGYRFSNDFAPLLFVMIALAGRRFSSAFWILGATAVVINGWGAVTFNRPAFAHRYFIDPTQEILHAPPSN